MINVKIDKAKRTFYHTIVANLFEMVSLSFGRRKIERKKKKVCIVEKERE